MANGFGDMLQQNPGIKGSQRVPLKGSGFQRLLAVLEGEPLEERIVQPGSGQTAEVSQVLPIFMMIFIFAPRKWFSRKSQRRGSLRVEPRACRPTRAWFRFLSKAKAASSVS